MSKLYLKNGYLNFHYLQSLAEPIVFVWGARGTGKTYGGLKELAITEPRRFLYLRRTAAQANSAAKDALNPFKEINNDCGTEIHALRVDTNVHLFCDCEQQSNGKWKCVGKSYGYTTGLTTIGSLRSVSLSDVEVVFFDEFVPQKSDKRMRDTGDMLANAYETVSRNRELQGRPPLKLIAVTNSNTERSDIMLDLGLAGEVHTLFQSGEWIRRNVNNGQIALIRMMDSPISKAKEETTLYRALRGSSYYDMAIKNEFAYDVPSRIKTISLSACVPLVTVGTITIYDIKGTPDYYVAGHRSGNPPVYVDGDVPLARFRRTFPEPWIAYLENRCVFQSYECELKFLDYYGAKL